MSSAWSSLDTASAVPDPSPRATSAEALLIGIWTLRRGPDAGSHADDYIRITIYLATVLSLVGISGHFRLKAARIGLIAVGSVILTYGVVLLIAAPKPPG